MDSRGLGFWGTVWAGVVVAAIVGIASWLFSFHHAAWLWLTSVASSIWTALISPVSIPVSVVVIFAAAFLYLLRRGRRRTVAATSTGERSPTIFGPLVAADSFEAQDEPTKPASILAEEPPPLTDNEIAIVRMFASVNTEWMSDYDITRRVRLHRLVAAQALDRLVARQFLVMVGEAYRLSRLGRDYVIEHGYTNAVQGDTSHHGLGW